MANHDAVFEELAAVQHERDRLLSEVHQLRHEGSQQKSELRRLHQQLQLASSLNLSLFTAPDPITMYGLLCQALVYQLHWDGAVVITMQGIQPVIHAYHGLAEGQIQHIRDYLAKNTVFASLYHAGNPHYTHQRSDTLDLSLRALFGADDLLFAPIKFADEQYAFVVVTAHTQKALKQVTQQELDVLTAVATLVAHAVQYNLGFKNLEDQNHRLLELDQLKDSFLSITSHQLRTPLSVIKWVLAALQSDADVQKLTDQHHLVTQAYATNERLIHVVTELLNVTRIQEGRLHCKLIDGNLGDVVKDLYERNSKLCENKGIQLGLTLPEEIPNTSIDQLLLKEALQSIVNNAIDYNLPENGTITLDLSLTKKEFVLAITNSGIGIMPQDREKIFTQFFRGENAQRQEPNGNGLGMYMTRVIIEEHGGSVDFISHPTKSTTFTVRLPLTLPDAA